MIVAYCWIGNGLGGAGLICGVIVLRVVFLAVLVYLGLVLVLFLFQARMVFLPNVAGRDLVATPSAVGLEYQELWLETDDGERLHGWWLPRPDARATLLFHHGNAGNISHRLDSLLLFHQLELNVLIFDYRGYGQSSGRPSEAGVYADARAAWNWLVDDKQIPPDRIVLFGRSMGGAIAAQLASEVNAGAMILESTFSSVPDVAAEIYWWLPVRWLARIRFPTIEHVVASDIPLLVVHSRDDEIIAFAHAERIVAAVAEGRAELLEIQGDHNTGFLRSGERYLAGLSAFLERHF